MAPSSPLLSPSSLKADEMTMNDLWEKSKRLPQAAWARTTRRMRVASAFVVLLALTVYVSLPTIRTYPIPSMPVPQIALDYYHPSTSPYNASKVALLIENRPLPILAPLMLHFMAVVPPDWRFRFMGSVDSVVHLNRSVAIQEQVQAGKLDLTYIPTNMSVAGQEMISRFLTNLWLYETVLQPAEWLLVFQTDSILCANSRQNINDYLDFDWVGAPWNPKGRYGGNGGLSLRRVSAMIEVLRDQLRVDGSEPEDVWLAERLAHRPGAKMANGTVGLGFSGEMFSGNTESIGSNADVAKSAAAALIASATAGLRAHAHSSSINKNLKNNHNNNNNNNMTGNMPANTTATNDNKPFEYVSGIDDWREGFYEPMGYHTGGSGNTLHSGIWGKPELRKHIWDYCPEVKMTLQMDVARFVPGDCHPSWKKKRDNGDVHGWEAAGPLGQDGAVGLAMGDAGGWGWGTEVIDGVEYPMLPPDFMAW